MEKLAVNLPFYNLDMIISLGYRVKSAVATNFRKWASERLKEYLIKGFTMETMLSIWIPFLHLPEKNY